MLKSEKKDYLWLNLRELPYFRALLRAVEARVYQDMDLPAPTLDLGCGDGHFAGIAFERPLEVGVDPWWPPLQEARERGTYLGLLQADGARLPFPDGYFGSAVSNSVLEHIPHLDAVLTEAARVLKPGALFVFCVPNHQFLSMLSVGRWLDRVGLRFLGNAYRQFFNRISRHHHCDTPEVWEARLVQAGFQVESWWHYFSEGALRTLEWGHYWGLPSWISKVLTGRFILSPAPWSLALARRLVQPYYNEAPQQARGAYTFYITHRK
jgi:SAM-dependent methyltransferase